MCRAKLFLVAGIAATLMGCSSSAPQEYVNCDWDHAVDFSQYRTFAYARGRILEQGQPKTDDILENRIHNSIVQNLKSKGLIEAEENPDVSVTYVLGATNQQEVAQNMPNVGFSVGGDYGWLSVGGIGGPQSRNYTQGSFVIEITDTGKRQVVYRAQSVGELRGPLSQQVVDKTTTRSLRDFPPKKK